MPRQHCRKANLQYKAVYPSAQGGYPINIKYMVFQESLQALSYRFCFCLQPADPYRKCAMHILCSFSIN